MISAVIKMGEDSITTVYAETIDEVLEKIKTYHTMTPEVSDYFLKKGNLQQQLDSCWYLNSNSIIEHTDFAAPATVPATVPTAALF